MSVKRFCNKKKKEKKEEKSENIKFIYLTKQCIHSIKDFLFMLCSLPKLIAITDLYTYIL